MPNGETGTGGFLERLRNSPRTVSTIIVILIILGAIFAFSDRGGDTQPSPSPTATASPTTEEATPTPEETESPTPAGETPAPSPTPTAEAQETERSYVEVAARGDGVTHLARRAMLKHLEANKPDFEVTAEHKIWIEDYLKDNIGRAPLRLGQTLEVEKEMIRTAVEKSKALTDAQRQQLQRFSRQVAAYR